MKKSIFTATITLAAAALAAGANAELSTASEFRGYQNCLETYSGEFAGLTTERRYLLGRSDAGRTYYINATAWDQGKRVRGGINCETTANGRKVLSREVSDAHFTPISTKPGVQVATQ
ncbi:MAG: hypothetical protein ACC642_05795 [Pseudomonadales bacterium]